MEFFINILKGMLIGIGGIAPGVSGGTFAMMLGVYDRITDSIGNFYKDFKVKFIFLSSIGIGVGIGIIGFSRILEYVFVAHEVGAKFVFIGIMLGSLPALVRESNKKGFQKAYILPFMLTLSLTVLFAIIDRNAVATKSIESFDFVEGIFYGGLIALGTIVPGISSSILLMYFGVYGLVLDAIGSLRLEILFPLGIGFGITILILSKGIHYMFKHYFGWTSYMVLGFVLGSVLALVPSGGHPSEYALGIVLAGLGAMSSYGVSRKLIGAK